MATNAVPESDYYDVLFLGRTGQGKSRTGNKLLVTESGGDIIREWQGGGEQQHLADKATGEGEIYGSPFKTGGGIESMTHDCEIMSNESTKIRVLDTPGFADTQTTKERGVFGGNLDIFRSILLAQEIHKLAFHRVCYFLPFRGPLERAEGTLQEEIKLMHGYFGEDVFKIMVIIATNLYRKKRKQGDFYEEDIEATERAFMAALEKVTGEEDIIERCPPIVYLPYDEKGPEVIKKIVSASVLCKALLEPSITVELPAKSKSPSIAELIISSREKNKGRKLQFKDRCVKCSSKLIYRDTRAPKEKCPIEIIFEEGGEEHTILYEQSKCHPIVVPRHSTKIKIFGGIAHTMTFGIFVGIGKIRGRKLWPGFTNNKEVCDNCHKPPSEKGCLKVGEHFPLKDADKILKIKTAHSTELDKLQIE